MCVWGVLCCFVVGGERVVSWVREKERSTLEVAFHFKANIVLGMPSSLDGQHADHQMRSASKSTDAEFLTDLKNL